MYNNMEVSRKLVELEIKNRKYLISLYDDVLECLKKFDGKQVTKRIETALKKIDNNISISNEYNSFIINLYFQDRMIKDENNCHYLKKYSDYICWCTKFSSYGDGVLNIDNSLNYLKLEKELLKTKDYLLKDIEELEDQFKNIDFLLEEYKELQKKCNDFNSKINHCISEYYNIKRF